MKLYTSPTVITSNVEAETYVVASWIETLVGSVVSGVVGGIVTDSLPGPAVPG